MLNAWTHQTLDKLPLFEPQGISNSAWAYAKLGHHNTQLFDMLASAAMAKLDRFNSQVCASEIRLRYTVITHVLLDKPRYS